MSFATICVPSNAMHKPFLSLLLCLALYAYANAQPAIPPQGGYWVHDEANILSPQTEQQLEFFLQRHRDSTSNQIGILIIPSLQDYDIDLFAVEVFKEWKIGQASKDNGVLLLVAVNDRKVRIEVGIGLEGALTDALSNRIIRNEIAPRFRANDYEGGVKAAIVAIVKAIGGEYQNENPGRRTGKKSSPFFTLLIIIIFIIIASRRGGGGRGRGNYWSSRNGWLAAMLLANAGRGGGGGGFGGGFGGSGGSWGSFGGGGISGGGGSSGSW